MKLKTYLDKIQYDESIFPIDSFPTKKKKRRVIKTIYPNENWLIIEQKRAMIDLDGTIHKYSKGYQDGTIYDKPFDGAKQAIDWLKKQGYEIVIFTTRASKENALTMGGDHENEIKKVKNWLANQDIYFDRVTAEKLPADFYIDDKAIVIKNGNWNAVLNVVKQRMNMKTRES